MRKLVLVILSVLLLCGCSNKKQEPLNSIEDFSGKKLGMCVGAFHDKFIDDNYGVDAIY